MSLYIVRKKLTASDVDVPGTRWNEDCNCVQTTPDGGETWVDNPGADPRQNPAYQRPPLTGDNVPCNAASAMSDRIKSVVDAYLNTGTIAATATSIFGLLTLVFPPAAIVTAILVFVDFLIVIGTLEVTAVMTTETYDTLKCIFLNNVDADGQLDDAAFAQVYDDIDAQLGEGASDISKHVLDLVGIVGINNYGALATETGDCADCIIDWCHVWEGADLEAAFVAGSLEGQTGAVWDGSSWSTQDVYEDPGGAHVAERAMYIIFDLGATRTLVYCKAEGTWISGSTGAFAQGFAIQDRFGTEFTGAEYGVPAPLPDYLKETFLVAPIDLDEIVIFGRASYLGFSGTFLVTKFSAVFRAVDDPFPSIPIC